MDKANRDYMLFFIFIVAGSSIVAKVGATDGYVDIEKVGITTISSEAINMESSLPIPNELPSTWRGFNIHAKANISDTIPFDNWILESIDEFGFNFVRIPIDYRFFVKEGDCRQINEDFFINELDPFIQCAFEHDIHVMLDLHVAPGIGDGNNLWSSTDCQTDYVKLWIMLAKRYDGIPNQKLTFNIINEPGYCEVEEYKDIIGETINGIHLIDADRLIIVNGLEYSTVPTKVLQDYENVTLAMHNYRPMALTHYQAPWTIFSDYPTEPQWPLYNIVNGTIKGNLQNSNEKYIIEGDFQKSIGSICVHQVSGASSIKIIADDTEVLLINYENSDESVDILEVKYLEEYGLYQNIYDKDYTFNISEGTKKITIECIGDWCKISNFNINQDNGVSTSINSNTSDWTYTEPAHIKVLIDGTFTVENNGEDKEQIQKMLFYYWNNYRTQTGKGYFVGEWVVYKFNSKDVTMKYMKDMLDLYDENKVGWTLWGFNSSFGIIDSYRAGVEYENYKGHKLDREMLELLQGYIKDISIDPINNQIYNGNEINPEVVVKCNGKLLQKDIDYTVTYEINLESGRGKAIIKLIKNLTGTFEKNFVVENNLIIENKGKYKIFYYFMKKNGVYSADADFILEGEREIGECICAQEFYKDISLGQNYHSYNFDNISSGAVVNIPSNNGVAVLNLYYINKKYLESINTTENIVSTETINSTETSSTIEKSNIVSEVDSIGNKVDKTVYTGDKHKINCVINGFIFSIFIMIFYKKNIKKFSRNLVSFS